MLNLALLVVLKKAQRTYTTCYINWAASWQNQQNECAPSEDSDQPWHPPSLIRVFAVRMKKFCTLSYPLSAQRRLWADWADAQADLSLRWEHSHIVGFVTRRLSCLTFITYCMVSITCSFTWKLIYWRTRIFWKQMPYLTQMKIMSKRIFKYENVIIRYRQVFIDFSSRRLSFISSTVFWLETLNFCLRLWLEFLRSFYFIIAHTCLLIFSCLLFILY